MKNKIATKDLPPIPSKRYFTIGEVSDLCAVKPHVLRYWEQEFSVLKPGKRRGSRRYYQEKDVNVARRIRTLLYDKGFTINGARKQLNHRKKDEVVTLENEPAEIRIQALCEEVITTSVSVNPENKVSDQMISELRGDLQALLTKLKS